MTRRGGDKTLPRPPPVRQYTSESSGDDTLSIAWCIVCDRNIRISPTSEEDDTYCSEECRDADLTQRHAFSSPTGMMVLSPSGITHVQPSLATSLLGEVSNISPITVKPDISPTTDCSDCANPRLTPYFDDLRIRLLSVRGLSKRLQLISRDITDLSADPVRSLWHLFSHGVALAHIFNLIPGIRTEIYVDAERPLDPKPTNITIFSAYLQSKQVSGVIGRCEPFTQAEVVDRKSTDGIEKVAQAVNKILNSLPLSRFDKTVQKWSVTDPKRLDQVFGDLKSQISDWKGLTVNYFGRLYLFDELVMSRSGLDRLYRLFLFEKIMIFCKDADEEAMDTALVLKGRIFSNVIQETIAVPSSSPGNFPLAVWWNGDIDLECLTLQCTREDQRARWQSTLNLVRDLAQHRAEKRMARHKHDDLQTSSPYIRRAPWNTWTHRRMHSDSNISLSELPRSTAVISPSMRRRSTSINSGSDQNRHGFSGNSSPVRFTLSASPQLGGSPLLGSETTWNGLYGLPSANSSESSLLSSATSIDSVISSGQSSIYMEIPEPSNTYDGTDLTGTVRKLDAYPFECGGVADLYRGELQSDLSLVAIKIFRRAHTDHQTMVQASERLYHEASAWSKLSHPNVLPFLGICRDVGPSIALITPLCSRGHVMKYLQVIPKTPKEKLGIILGIASGMVYLHGEGIVHGNFTTSKVLMDDHEVPVICAHAPTVHSTPSGNQATMALSPIRYTAPECFALNNHATAMKTESSDVYSFSMVVLEIFSGLQPYHDIVSEPAVLFHIVQGGRPKRDEFDPSVFHDHLWSLLNQLWNQLPAFRPDMTAVLRRLNALYAGNDFELDPNITTTNTFPRRRHSARTITEHPETSHGDSSSSSSGEETSYADLSARKVEATELDGRVSQDDQYPFAAGGNSNIYKGKVSQPDGRRIRAAIKMIRISDDGSGQMEEVVRRLRREAAIWSILSHRNLLPFMGICNDMAPWPVLVSPFYKHGHIQTYLQRHPNCNRRELIMGVASGLEYLHSNDVVHGDLKAQNILIDKRGHPCICDFGISKVIGSRGFTTISVGTAPYMAPELFFVIDAISEDRKLPSTTKSSDVYSFGLVALEIITGKPLQRRPIRPIITSKIHSELHPQRADYESFTLVQKLWDILDNCWAFEPPSRPTMGVLVSKFSERFSKDAKKRTHV